MQRALSFLSPYFVVVLALALVSAWLVRAMKARSFVKVQREGLRVCALAARAGGDHRAGRLPALGV